jgi:CheY-like chemotaxis protein
MSQSPVVHRVLVIEDEKALLDFFAFDFAAAGYEVFVARDGEEGLSVLDEQHVDAVVSDIQLPKKTGIEVLEQVRTLRDPGSPAFIFISGNLQLKAEQYFHLGVNAFFNKPFNRQELLDSLSYYLKPRAVRWELTQELLQVAQGRLDLSLDSYDSAADSGMFRLGQGGFFLGLDRDFPEPGDKLSFQIRFLDQGGTACEGVGEVRWVRFRADANGPTGIGVEFKGMSEASVLVIERLLSEKKPVPFIPKS